MLKGVDFHHAADYADDIKEKQFAKTNAYHKTKFNFKSSLDFYLGYHFFIERDGETIHARKIDEDGAHNKTGWLSNRNKKAIGICFAGNMELQKLTNEQVIAAVELVRGLQEKQLIDPDESNYFPHRHWKATACPGKNVPDNTWSFLVQLYDVLQKQLVKEDPIVAWHKKAGILTQFSTPPTKEELRDAWLSYKILKMMNSGDFRKLTFPF